MHLELLKKITKAMPIEHTVYPSDEDENVMIYEIIGYDFYANNLADLYNIFIENMIVATTIYVWNEAGKLRGRLKIFKHTIDLEDYPKYLFDMLTDCNHLQYNKTLDCYERIKGKKFQNYNGEIN